jgi:hypothetical protein
MAIGGQWQPGGGRSTIGAASLSKGRCSHPRKTGAPAGVDRTYHLHDKVQVNARGVGWMDGEIVSIADGIETEYKVAVSGNRFLLASYHDLRFVAAAPTAVAFQAGQPPKPGLSSCAGRFEGRYGPAAGPGPTICAGSTVLGTTFLSTSMTMGRSIRPRVS